MSPCRRLPGLVVLLGVIAACGAGGPAPPTPDATDAKRTEPEVEWFVDGAEAAGLDFVHFNGMTGRFYSPEMTGPGDPAWVVPASFLDYDRDGWLRTDGSTLRRRARADGSFASANDPRVLVGLGESAGVSLVRVTWPSRRVEEWADLEVDGYITLTEGRGRPR